MLPDQLFDSVARRARIESQTTAERATLAALQTLGEHVSEGQAEDIAAEPPDGIAETVTDRSAETPESFSPGTFVRRVAEREADEVDENTATTHTRAVFAALSEAGLDDELRDARGQLPDEFATLFETDELERQAEAVAAVAESFDRADVVHPRPARRRVRRLGGLRHPPPERALDNPSSGAGGRQTG